MRKKPLLEARYDPRTNRWIDESGHFVTKEQVMEVEAKIAEALSTPVHFNPHPISDRMAERLITVDAALESMAKQQDARPMAMPSDTYNAMLLSEYFYDTEGDIWQTVSAPAEIALKPIVAQSEDPGLQREAQSLVEYMHLDELVQEMFYSIETYGQAYPLEDWDQGSLQAVHLLNPKLIWTDQLWNFGTADASLQNILSRMNSGDFEYHGPGDLNRDNQPTGVYTIPRKAMWPLYAPKQEWQRYATPPLRRSFRSLAIRQTLDEMIRATIEGYRNQLWVFKIGTPERSAKAAEINYLKDLISGAAGDRTGHIVWNYDLVVEQHAPKSLDELLGNERWDALTRKIFVERGISTRLVSGNSGTMQDRNIEVDVQILISRLKTRRARMEEWLGQLVRKVAVAEKWGKTVILSFGRITLEDEATIKNRIVPLYTVGLLSPATALEDSGYRYDTEVARKQDTDTILWAPPATFAQMTVNPNTPAQTTESNPTPKPERLTPKPEDEAPKAEASWEGDMKSRWEALLRGEITQADFLRWMRYQSAASLAEAYANGYGSAGAQSPFSAERQAQVARWNEDYLSKMGVQMAQSEDLGVFWSRVQMYPQQGQRTARALGIQDAMAAMGYISWQRVLHPELSKSGPCAACIKDSRIIHPITEEWSDHPQGVCSAQWLVFYPGSPESMPITFSIPGAINFVRRAPQAGA